MIWFKLKEEEEQQTNIVNDDWQANQVAKFCNSTQSLTHHHIIFKLTVLLPFQIIE